MRLSFLSTALMTVTLLAGAVCQGAVQYWDPSSAAGYQQGDGAWSATETNWSTNGTLLSAWVNTNDAVFPTKGGASAVTLTSSLTSSAVTVTGSVYTLIVTNGGRLVSTAVAIGGGKAANDNQVEVVGGAGSPSVWAATAISVGGGNTTSLNGASNNVWVIDGRGVSGSAVTTNSGTLDVGQQALCPSNEFKVIGGGRLFSGGATTIGSATVGNVLRVQGTGSVWTAGSADTTVGSGASAQFNSLVVEAGGMATNSGNLWVGRLATGANNNHVRVSSGGALYVAQANICNSTATGNVIRVQGAGSRFGCSALTVGYGANSLLNLFVAEDGAQASHSGAMILGNSSSSASNDVRVTGGSRLASAGSVTLGSTSMGNAVRVSGAGSQWNVGGQALTIGSGAGALNNLLAVEDSGVVTNTGAMTIGVGSNKVSLTAGGSLFSGGATILSGMSNSISVSGNGSQWNTGSSAATVGSGASAYNTVTVDGLGVPGGATATIATLAIGYNGTAAMGYNAVIVTNGGVLNLGAGANWGSAVGHGIGVVDGNVYASKSNALVITQGGKVYAGGALMVGYNDYNANLQGNRLAILGADSSLDMRGNGLYAPLSFAANQVCIAGVEIVVDGGMATNVGGLVMPYVTGGQAAHNNFLTLTNGGRFYAVAPSSVGGTYPGTNNVARVTGSNSLWDLGSSTLAVGNVAGTNNGVIIDQGGRLDSISTLTVYSNNSLSLLGGTLGVANWTLNNGAAFTVGDGAQAATLKGLGGSLLFNAGLQVPSNGVLAGAGIIGGGPVGIALASGSALSPGVDGVGTLTVAGTGLTWQAGAAYRCDVTNLDLGPGAGWDLVAVTGQVAFAAGAVIRLDSRGSVPGRFDAGRNYNVRILSYGSQSGFDASSVVLETNAFLAPGTWSLTNVASSLYLVYRGGGSSPLPNYAWNVPNRGNWSVNGNWQGGSAPAPGGGASLILSFGDNGTPYVSTNDLAGGFLLNQMQFSGSSLTTNIIKGSPLVFTNAGAAMDCQTAAGGVFIVSNSILSAGNLEIGGNAFAGTLALGGVLTNKGILTKKGSYTLALSGANDFSAPLVVDSPDGTLRLDNVNGLNGAGSVTLSNGTLAVNQGTIKYYFANSQHNRRGLVTGKGSVWTNWASAENTQSGFSLGATNVSFTLDGGSMFWTVRFHAFDNASMNGTAVVTNGGLLKMFSATYGGYLAYMSTNCAMTVTGPDSVFNTSGHGFIVAYGPASGNAMRIENGATVTNLSNVGVGGGGGCISNSLTVTNGGRFGLSGIVTIGAANAANNTFLLTGSNTFLPSASLVYGGTGAGARDNAFVIDDGAVATNVRMIVADGCSSNRMIIRNRGKLFASTGYDQIIANVIAFEVSNVVWVTGAGSLWNMAGKHLFLSSGNSNVQNRLSIDAGGMVTNVGTLFLATGIGSSSNTVVVDGGILQAGTLAWKNLLPNDVTLTGAGQMNLIGFTLSNVNQRLLFNGGLLTVKSAVVSNTLEFTVGDGTQAATFNLVSGGTNIFSSGLAVSNGATLGGSGLLVGTSVVHGALSPGLTGVGALTNNGPLTLNAGSISRFDVTAATVPGAGWDWLTVTNGALALGGKLTPVLKDGFTPVKADRFLIMTNQGPGTVTGGFGGRVTIYAENLKTRAGTFRVDAGPQGVVLTDYQAWRPDGALMILY